MKKRFPVVFTYLMRLTGNRHLTDTLILDVFEMVWCEAPVFDTADGPVLGWFVRHARSLALTHAGNGKSSYGDSIRVAVEVPADLVPLETVATGRQRTWHGNRVIGRFYIDPFPRDGKYMSWRVARIRIGTKGGPVPEAVLIMNTEQGRMDHVDVVTFFHEYGHLLHQIFSGQVEWTMQHSRDVESDVIEAPSQVLEAWAWDHDTLSRFACDEAGPADSARSRRPTQRQPRIERGLRGHVRPRVCSDFLGLLQPRSDRCRSDRCVL